MTTLPPTSSARRLTELSFEDLTERMRAPAPAGQTRFYAMYSSWHGGLFREPGFMTVPIDEHMVHRGDGVFEAIKCVDARIYGLDQHLDRLSRSAARIGMKLAFEPGEIREICVETVRYAGRGESAARNCLLRLYNSRGPGNFTPNPYDTVGSQLYLVITPFTPPSAAKYESGVRAALSQVAVKEGFLATVKSCNYLPNVLMKKEAVDLGVDFTISRDEHGFLAESSTENFGIVTRDGRFVLPGFDRTLRGITAVRALELARDRLQPQGLVRSVSNASLTAEDVAQCSEAMMLGTTIDCLPVTTFGGKPVGDGKVGPVARALLACFKEDLQAGPLVTEV